MTFQWQPCMADLISDSRSHGGVRPHMQFPCFMGREVVRDSQMTVPETPSPDFVARRRRPLAAHQPSGLSGKSASTQVCKR